jgi:glycosyltransferase involved in cell wall biosynthesis
MKPKILLVSDDARINTGFSRVAREIILHLVSTQKYHVAQHGWFSGNPQHEVPIQIFPTMSAPDKPGALIEEDLYGKLSFDRVVASFRPDVVLAIGNYHMIHSTVESRMRNTFRLIHYVPVDNFHPGTCWADTLMKCDELYLYCPWAADVIKKRVPQIRVAGTIPHGVDVETFRPAIPERKAAIRRGLNMPIDSFVIGFVGRNLERKRVDQVIITAAHLLHGTYTVMKNGRCIPFDFSRTGDLLPKLTGPTGGPKNVSLLLHVPVNDKMGPDLSPVIEQFDMGPRTHCDTTYKVSQGVPDAKLALLYQAMDVFISYAPGGAEMTNMEAMATGLPLIVGNWSAPPDFCGPGSLFVDPVGWYSDMHSGILRPLPDIGQAIQHLRTLMSNPNVRTNLSEASRNAAEELSWKKVNKHWENVIDSLLKKQVSPFAEI